MRIFRSHNNTNALLLPVSLLTALMLILTLFSSMSPDSFWWLFSSDALYLPSLYRDWFIDGRGPVGWHFNPSPNFFPDMAAYFLLMFLTGGNIILSTSLYGLLQYFAIVLLFHSIIRRFTDLHTARLITAFGNLLLAMLLISPIRESFMYLGSYLLINSYHSSILVLTLTCFLLYMDYLEKGKIWRLLLMFLISTLAVLSDKINLVAFNFPVAVLAILFFRLPYPRLRIILGGMAGLAAGYAGIWIFSQLNALDTIHFDLPHKIFLFEEIWIAGKLMVTDITKVLINFSIDSILMLVALISLAWTVTEALIVLTRKKYAIGKGLYILFVAIFSASVLVAPVINGNYSSFDCLRYNIYPLYLALLNLPLLIFTRSKAGTRLRQAGFVLLVVVAAGMGLTHFSFTGLRDYPFTYPARVRAVDEAAREHGIKYGVGTYWEAKFITQFSREGLRIYSVHSNLNKYYHVANEAWYHEPEAIFSFVVAKDVERAVMDSLFRPENVQVVDEVPGMFLLPAFVYHTDRWEPVPVQGVLR